MKTTVLGETGRFFGARIRERLLVEIKRRSANDRLPTETELARQYGVNRLTVNRVMAELSRDGYIERIRGKGTFVSRPDHRVLTGRNPRRGLGQIVIAYPDYFSFDLWRKINCAEGLAHQHEIELVNFKMNKGTAFDSVAAMICERGEQVKGAIVLPPSSIIDAKNMAVLDSLAIPVVLLAACERGPWGKNLVTVHRDYYKDGFLATDHLIRAGHKRIGYIANEPWNLATRLQYQGVKAALYAHDYNLRDLARSPNGIASWEDAMQAGHRFTVDLLAKHPRLTGLMYRSILGAVGGMRAITESGRRIPDDISIIAEGEASALEDYLTPPMTNTVCDYSAWIQVAFDVLLNPTRGHEKQITVDVRLLPRKSVRTIQEADAAAQPRQR